MSPESPFEIPQRPSQAPIPDALPGPTSPVRDAFYNNFETILVTVLIASLVFIQSFVVHKFAFLLFYFIPVLLSGFYRSARHAIMTALLSSGLVIYFTLVDTLMRTADDSFRDWNLLIWACFLILTGAIVGRIQDKNRLRAEQLRQAYLGIVQILVKYLETADQYTKSHSERVAAVCMVLGRRMGLDAAGVQNVWSAALLHDIGKIEVIELIRKEADLSDEEKEQIDQHTELGAQLILTTGTVLNDVIPLILHHHTRYDIDRDSAPLGARIISVADTYDAVITDRPYRAGRMHFQAVEIIAEGAGTQFDPKVVQALKESEEEIVRIYQDMPAWSGK